MSGKRRGSDRFIGLMEDILESATSPLYEKFMRDMEESSKKPHYEMLVEGERVKLPSGRIGTVMACNRQTAAIMTDDQLTHIVGRFSVERI